MCIPLVSVLYLLVVTYLLGDSLTVRVNTNYRTIVLQLYPINKKQERALRRAEVSVTRAVGMGRFELQKLLYTTFKEADLPIHGRTVDLLVQRFTGSLGEKALIPFDNRNSRILYENGMWFFEFSPLKPVRKGGRAERIKVLISKTGVEYYEVLDSFSQPPVTITRENDRWFMYVSIPVGIPEPDPNNVVGVDFNFRRWVVAPPEGSPMLFFRVTKYNVLIEQYMRRIQSLRSKLAKAINSGDGKERRDRLEKLLKEYQEGIKGIVKKAQGEFLKAIEERFGKDVTIAVENVNTMYKMVREEDKPKTVKNWLNMKTRIRQFIARAMAHGHHVIEVDPRGTSTTCHRCGAKLIIYGKHKRLVKCPNCGLVDYDRDLNASRNIAKRGREAILKQLEKKKEREAKKQTLKPTPTTT